jgi:hypothetical protein
MAKLGEGMIRRPSVRKSTTTSMRPLTTLGLELQKSAWD